MLRFPLERLRELRAQGQAVPAFSVYNGEQIRGALRAATSAGRPILLQAGSSSFGHLGRAALASMALASAQDGDATAGVHLDHSRDVAEVEFCLRRGYSSVMIDGSYLPFEENVELTREVVRLAEPFGAWVEGELVGTAGDEDISTGAAASGRTDPDAARDFVGRTGVHALAVAVGNVHGATDTPPALDLVLLEQIAGVVDQPLVLHGASGVRESDLHAAVRLGVAKVNVNTELRQAFLAALPAPGNLTSDSLPSALAPAIAATTRVCDGWIDRLARAASGNP